MTNDANDMMKHVRELRRETSSFEEQADPPEIPPAVPPPVVQAPAQAPQQPLTVAPVFEQPMVAPVLQHQPLPPLPPPPVAVTPQQQQHLASLGLPVSPQQMQYLVAGYPLTQILYPQQLAALGLGQPLPPPSFHPSVAPAAPQPTASLLQQMHQQVTASAVQTYDVVDSRLRSINFGIIGCGQGGSRIAEAFYRLGYPTCVINTASHDLKNINIPEDNKLLLKVGAGGAGKVLKEGEAAASDYFEDILDLMKNTFPKNVDHILICVGGGGGSGSGSLPKVIDIAKLMKVPVGVVYTMPQDSEGRTVKENAYDRAMLLDKKLEAGEISPLILIDNNKIHQMHTGASVATFWRLANAQVTGLFHLFNVLSAQNSAYTSLDPADYKTIINKKGCIIYGSTVVEDLSRKTAVSKALRDNIAEGLLAEGFDLTESNIAGMIITGSQELMENIPQEYIDAATECLERVVGGGTIHYGVYNENVKNLTVYTLIGGLTLPMDRIKRLLRP